MTTTEESLVDNKAIQVISNIRNLPTPPIVFNQIQKVINDPNVSADHIASILSEDPAMSVKVLKLTNSAFYGLSREVESVKHAVVIVGMEAVKNLVLAASVLDMFKGKSVDSDFQDTFWRHSLAVGSCAKLLAKAIKTRGTIDPDAAFSGGLLHDIGKMILACFLNDEYNQVQQEASQDPETPIYLIENKLLGYNHADIGAMLAKRWKLPTRLQQGIGLHHTPELEESKDPIAYFIHAGNHIAKATFLDNSEARLDNTVTPRILDYLQISEELQNKFADLLREEYVKAETFIQMAGIG